MRSKAEIRCRYRKPRCWRRCQHSRPRCGRWLQACRSSAMMVTTLVPEQGHRKSSRYREIATALRKETPARHPRNRQAVAKLARIKSDLLGEPQEETEGL